MSFARIITRSTENSRRLAKDLLARGYEVETVSPDQIPSRPADLEITIEECPVSEVLRKAAEIPDAQDLSVFISPRAITDTGRPMEVIALTPELENSVDNAFAQDEAEQAQEAIKDCAVVEEARTAPVLPEIAAVEAQTTPPADLEEPAVEMSPLSRSIDSREAAPLSAEFVSAAQDGVVSEPESESSQLDAPTITNATTVEAETRAAEEMQIADIQPLPNEVAVPLHARNDAPELKDLLLQLESVIAGMDGEPEAAGQANYDRSTSEPESVDGETLLQSDSALLDDAIPNSDWPIWKPPLSEEAAPAQNPVMLRSPSSEQYPAAQRPSALALMAAAAAQFRNQGKTAVDNIRKRIQKDERMFWGAAVTAGVVAVSALLLGAAFHRISPLPSQLSPVHSAADSVAESWNVAGAPSSGKAAVSESPKPASELLKPASIRKREATEDSNIIAPDTVIHYLKREPVAAKKSAATTKKASSPRHRSDTDIVAEDTVTHYDPTTGTPTQARKAPR